MGHPLNLGKDYGMKEYGSPTDTPRIANTANTGHPLYRTALIFLSAAALAMGPPRRLEAAELRNETLIAWAAYVQGTEQRIQRELSAGRGFLALDFQSTSAAERKLALSGGIPIAEVQTLDSSGKEIQVPSGMIHHWRGAVLIPGVALNDILARVQHPEAYKLKQEDVLASTVLERKPDSLRLYLKLQRSKVVTVVYNTEHLIHYSRPWPNRAFSTSIATKIAELQNPNTAAESEKPLGRDRGFLWRLNSYWRYEQVDGGVIVECESITLSRSIPALLDLIVHPLIEKVARESMNRTLASMRSRVAAEKPFAAGIN